MRAIFSYDKTTKSQKEKEECILIIRNRENSTT